MPVLNEVTESFDAGSVDATVTTLNTIFQTITTTTTGSSNHAIFTADSRSGLAITRPGTTTSQCQFARAVPGGAFSNTQGSFVNVLVPPLGGFMRATQWRKIDYGSAGGLAQNVMYIETQNVVEWETNGNGVYTDYEACSILTAPSYVGQTGAVAGNNLFISQRISYISGNQFAAASFQKTYYTIPLGVWLKFEIFYYENGSSQATVTDEAGAVLVDTGVVAGPSGWRGAAAWGRLRSYTNPSVPTEFSRSTIDDFRLAVETFTAPVYVPPVENFEGGTLGAAVSTTADYQILGDLTFDNEHVHGGSLSMTNPVGSALPFGALYLQDGLSYGDAWGFSWFYFNSNIPADAEPGIYLSLIDLETTGVTPGHPGVPTGVGNAGGSFSLRANPSNGLWLNGYSVSAGGNISVLDTFGPLNTFVDKWCLYEWSISGGQCTITITPTGGIPYVCGPWPCNPSAPYFFRATYNAESTEYSPFEHPGVLRGLTWYDDINFESAPTSISARGGTIRREFT